MMMNFPLFNRTIGHKAFFSLWLIAIGLVLATPAQSQNFSNGGDLTQDLERLRRDVLDLQKIVYQGRTPPPVTNLQNVGGQTTGPLDPSLAGQYQLKFQEIDTNMRGLNGKIEELSFRLQTLSTQLSKLSQDIDYRFAHLNDGAKADGSLSAANANTNANSNANINANAGINPVATAPASNATPILVGPANSANSSPTTMAGASQPQALGNLRTNAQGTIVGSDVNPKAAVNVAASEPSPPPTAAKTAFADNPADAYKQAFSWLQDRQFDQAEAGFKQFLKRWPNDELAGNARYWLGETYYAEGNFDQAASAFIDTYTKSPKSPKAPASLLKLALSLEKLNKIPTACEALQTLKDQYPKAEATLLQQASGYEKKFCKKP